MLKKIYRELILIRKELQAIRSSEEPHVLARKLKSKVIKVNGVAKRVSIDYDISSNIDS